MIFVGKHFYGYEGDSRDRTQMTLTKAIMVADGNNWRRLETHQICEYKNTRNLCQDNGQKQFKALFFNVFGIIFGRHMKIMPKTGFSEIIAPHFATLIQGYYYSTPSGSGNFQAVHQPFGFQTGNPKIIPTLVPHSPIYLGQGF